uniref:Uncharacterized protein n=1 Tax=Physcomitrium patens TaxID=3218 RepID=A0A7I4DCK9_PHYPA
MASVPAIPVDEAVAALSTFSLEDEQPDLQGMGVTLVSGRVATESPVDYDDVPAYQLSLVEDTSAVTQLVFMSLILALLINLIGEDSPV